MKNKLKTKKAKELSVWLKALTSIPNTEKKKKNSSK
jgi:hypothetical protein